MNQFIGGVIVGTLLTASLGLAGNLYDSKGQPAAPRGSIQSYDYFRQRQQQLDIGAMRQQADRERFDRSQKIPCEK